MHQETTKPALKSDLARLCLPAQRRDADRGITWMNSICACVLLIGVVGAGPAVVTIRPPPGRIESVPTILEPATPKAPMPVRALTPLEEPHNSDPAAPEVVVVTPDTPEISFSIPTLGSIAVPAALAVAPPLRPLAAPARHPTAPVTTMVPRPLDPTGVGGERPQPPYPRAAIERRHQGTVVLSLTVDAAGTITEAAVKQSSGSSILDDRTLEFVLRRWKISPGDGARQFEATVRYVLESG